MRYTAFARCCFGYRIIMMLVLEVMVLLSVFINVGRGEGRDRDRRGPANFLTVRTNCHFNRLTNQAPTAPVLVLQTALVFASCKNSRKISQEIHV